MQLTGLVFASFIGAFIFSFSLQHLFGMVNALQFVAHMPLNTINLPHSCWKIFGVLIQVVSFDFLPYPYGGIIDFGFTETDAWSTNFDYLGYGSINFIENMGSIMLWSTILLVQGLLVALFNIVGPCRRFKRSFWLEVLHFKQEAITFFYEAAFELLISTSVAMQILQL